MISTHIPPEQVALNIIIRHIGIAFNMDIMDRELRINISEDALLDAATKIVSALPDGKIVVSRADKKQLDC